MRLPSHNTQATGTQRMGTQRKHANGKTRRGQGRGGAECSNSHDQLVQPATRGAEKCAANEHFINFLLCGITVLIEVATFAAYVFQ